MKIYVMSNLIIVNCINIDIFIYNSLDIRYFINMVLELYFHWIFFLKKM